MEHTDNAASAPERVPLLDPSSSPSEDESQSLDFGVPPPTCQSTIPNAPDSSSFFSDDPTFHFSQTDCFNSCLAFPWNQGEEHDFGLGGETAPMPTAWGTTSSHESLQNGPWGVQSFDAPPYQPSSSNNVLKTYLELCNFQIQSLMSKVQVLEASLQESEKKIEEFSGWSKKMEKHSQYSSDLLTSLFESFKRSGYLRSSSHEDHDGMPTLPLSSVPFNAKLPRRYVNIDGNGHMMSSWLSLFVIQGVRDSISKTISSQSS